MSAKNEATSLEAMVSKNNNPDIETINDMIDVGNDDEPLNMIVGNNLGNTTLVANVPIMKFIDRSIIANDSTTGDVAQRKLDPAHARNLAGFMLKGLVHATIIRFELNNKVVPDIFEEIEKKLGTKPYCALQPVVVNIKDLDLKNKNKSIRIFSGTTDNGDIVGYKIYMPTSYKWRVIDGQHRRFGGEMLIEWLKDVTRNGKYPSRSSIVDFKGDVTKDELVLWNEVLSCANTFAALKIEFHLGLNLEQERQLFHDLNNLGKRINPSLATSFDQGNPINNFIRETIEGRLEIRTTDKDVKDWSKDNGEILTKDLAAINAIAFLNKTNVNSATPGIVDERSAQVARLWSAISTIKGFGSPNGRRETIAMQTVVLKSLAKLTFDFLFSSRRPEDGDTLYDLLIDNINYVDFSHGNPMWRFYEMSGDERTKGRISDLANYLPNLGVEAASSNRDIGSYQDGIMRFGAKHNDIYPILGDMIRWKLGLPNRHVPK